MVILKFNLMSYVWSHHVRTLKNKNFRTFSCEQAGHGGVNPTIELDLGGELGDLMKSSLKLVRGTW